MPVLAALVWGFPMVEYERQVCLVWAMSRTPFFEAFIVQLCAIQLIDRVHVVNCVKIIIAGDPTLIQHK